MRYRVPSHGAACIMSVSLLYAGVAAAAEPDARIDSFRDRFEVRLGAGLHGIGSVERGSAAINAELIFPRPQWLAQTAAPGWEALVPRPHIGAMVDFSGRTSYAYAGAVWTAMLTERMFVEGFFGGAIHDGSRAGDLPNHRSPLGCRLLFHAGGSLGYQLTARLRAMVTFDHVSNGNDVLHACVRNQGLNQYLIRVGYSF